MPALSWDQVEDRRFETGVDRGVLYIDGRGVAWNGLRSVEDATARSVKSFYQDGIKFLDHQVLEEFSGSLTAYTYPDEFEEIVGVTPDPTGFYVHDQRAQTFGLSYRTKIGNADGPDFGYRIHMLYNLRAVPASTVFATIESSVTPLEFSWQLSSTPVILPGYRPTSHLSVKSTDMEPGRLKRLEEGLYGTETAEPRLPPMEELLELIFAPVPPPFVITDNGDGTWTVSGSPERVVLLEDGSFQIYNAPAVFLDDGSYQITTT